MLRPHAQIGAYTLLHALGEGGMGVVFAAEHRYLFRPAAIKLLKPEVSGNPVALERFFNEARATMAVSHPGIVKVLDCGVHDGQAFLVMELLEGETLYAHFRSTPASQRSSAAVLDVGLQVAQAMEAAHAAHIVHRDLKPANIFLGAADSNGRRAVKVLDFGVAKLLHPGAAQLTRSGAVFGTALYMAPEQCQASDTVDGRADIYALGCILYEGLTGEPPRGLAAPATEARLPEPVLALLRRMVAPDPAERSQSMREVAESLERLAAEAAARRRARPRRRAAVRWAAGAALIGGGVAVLMGWGPFEPREEATATAMTVAAPVAATAGAKVNAPRALTVIADRDQIPKPARERQGRREAPRPAKAREAVPKKLADEIDVRAPITDL
jgi:eukaryotic-like serine/threonine-protein kinase